MAAPRSASKAPKTQPTGASVAAFLAARVAPARLADAKAIVKMMEAATRKKAAMWGDAIVGCDTYLVRYADGRATPWPLVAFSPRASSFVLYIGWKRHADLVKTAGAIKTAGGCLHLTSLDKVDRAALQALITAAATSRKAAAT
jgi:hypothetical protein